MWVVLEDDLVDSCKAGDDVTICGVVMRRWKPVFVDVSVIRVVLKLFAQTMNIAELKSTNKTVRSKDAVRSYLTGHTKGF